MSEVWSDLGGGSLGVAAELALVSEATYWVHSSWSVNSVALLPNLGAAAPLVLGHHQEADRDLVQRAEAHCQPTHSTG